MNGHFWKRLFQKEESVSQQTKSKSRIPKLEQNHRLPVVYRAEDTTGRRVQVGR